jgi:hypothetical protein
MVAGRARKLYDEAAAKRKGEGQKSGGRGHKKNLPENLPESFFGDARDQAAKAVGASQLVSASRTRLKNGDGEPMRLNRPQV